MLQTETMGKRLKELREKKALNQEELAQELKVTRATIANYEKNRRIPDADTIIFLADYFDVSCDYLLRGIKSENSNIHSYTGLSDKAIENLHSYFEDYISYPHQISVFPTHYYFHPFEFINLFLEKTKESDFFNSIIKYFNLDLSKYSINYDNPYEYFCSESYVETTDDEKETECQISHDIIDIILKDAAIVFGDKYKSFVLEDLTNQFRNYMLDCKSQIDENHFSTKNEKSGFYTP